MVNTSTSGCDESGDSSRTHRSRRRVLQSCAAAGTSLLAISTLAGQASAETLEVNPTNQSGYDSIQAAVDAASEGATIDVAPAVYNERVRITTSGLTLRGTPGGKEPGAGSDPPVLEGESNPGQAFRLDSGVRDLTIEGFQIQNYGTGPHARGHGVFASDPSTDRVTISNNTFENFGWNAIHLWSEGGATHSEWQIQNNRISGATFAGVQLTNTRQSTVENNEVIGSQETGDTSQFFPGEDGTNTAVGILVTSVTSTTDLHVGDLSINANDVDGVFQFAALYAQAFVRYGSDASPTVKLENLTVAENSLSDGLCAIGLGSFQPTSEISDVEIHNNVLTDSTAGILPYMLTETNHSSVTIRDNTITDNDYGIQIPDGFDCAEIHARGNSIVGNAEFGVKHEGSGTLDARETWWGHPSGPGGPDGWTNPADREIGRGDDIEGDVRFEPWRRRPL